MLRHKFLFGVLGACAILLLGILAGIAILLSGAFSTAATNNTPLLRTGCSTPGSGIPSHANADEIEAPALTDRGADRPWPRPAFARIACIAMALRRSRAEPHGLGMMPIPNDLTEAARDWPPAWLYYVTAKGVRMTGMPAWEFRLSDADLWSTVAFLKLLPHPARAEFVATSSRCPLAERCRGDDAIARHRTEDDR